MHLNSPVFAGGGTGLERVQKSFLRFLIPWYSNSSSLLVFSFFRFSFFPPLGLCVGSLGDDDEDDEDEDDSGTSDDDDDDDDDAGTSDWRGIEVGRQSGRLTAIG